MPGWRGGRVAGSAMVATLLAVAGCGDSSGPAGGQEFPALAGRDVISATRAESTAKAIVVTHASTAEPPEEHGASGYEEQDLRIEANYDFTRDSSLLRWEFPPLDFLGEESPPVKVEARSVGDTTYVRDGSWLCPGCGLDGDEPLPSDKWITVPAVSGDKAFQFTGVDAFSGQLGWIELVESPVAPSEVSELDGEPVGVYEVELSVGDIEGALEDARQSSLELQGETVTIAYVVDDANRLRRLIVKYRADDRDNTIAASVGDFGEPVSIEVPPSDEIYDG